MSGKRKKPDDPREWLNRARSNLARSRLALPGIYFEDLCFDAQQAAEKAIKAVLIFKQIRYPYIHDLGKLLYIAERRKIKVSLKVRRAARLTRYAVSSRYPGLDEPVSDKEQKEAVKIAENVIIDLRINNGKDIIYATAIQTHRYKPKEAVENVEDVELRNEAFV